MQSNLIFLLPAFVLITVMLAYVTSIIAYRFITALIRKAEDWFESLKERGNKNG